MSFGLAEMMSATRVRRRYASRTPQILPAHRIKATTGVTIPSTPFKDPYLNDVQKKEYDEKCGSPVNTVPSVFNTTGGTGLIDELEKFLRLNNISLGLQDDNTNSDNANSVIDKSSAAQKHLTPDHLRLPNGDFDLEVPYRMPEALSDQE
ncbi:hypothetical protein K3495_g3110 [Podosphaera aphanis]|nr:hypothetical protein K3495_g3110 [Podosphaera aphanis]